MAILDSYSESSHVADQVADLPPKMAILDSLLIDSYSESSHVADQVADLPPKNGNFRFLLIDSYSPELRCGRSGGRSTPQKWQFYIPIYRFLL